ncbi:hypothetical protein CPC08DRAFT_642657, partial [Agrocybe pediades]
GSPLWIPEPPYNLPTQYQLKGASIGDVGVLSPSGSFDFFFNICYPSDDPINSGGVPKGFKSLDPPLNNLNIRRVQEFDSGSYVASESIEISRRQYRDSPQVLQLLLFYRAADLVFESSAAEGAILTMPKGAHSEDVTGTRRLRGYIAEHIESWYKFVVGVRDCDAENGDILLVTGCDKTDSWGVASFVKSSEAVKLRFQPVESGHSYKWEYSGSFDARTGPNTRTIEGIRPFVASEPLLNQCVFVRTLTGTLRDDVWQSLRRSLYLEVGLDPDEELHGREDFMRNEDPGISRHGGSPDNSGNSMRGGEGRKRQLFSPDIEPPISVGSNVSTAMVRHHSFLVR